VIAMLWKVHTVHQIKQTGFERIQKAKSSVNQNQQHKNRRKLGIDSEDPNKNDRADASNPSTVNGARGLAVVG
jgi:hypothetical protein